MRVLPIIFSAAMVRALLEGRKTQTRRIVKLYPSVDGKRFAVYPPERIIELEPGEFARGVCHYESTAALSGPYKLPYAVGDLLWVREAWARHTHRDADGRIWPPGHGHSWGSPIYRATFGGGLMPECEGFTTWKPSIHMPRWASRLTLRVTAVKVEKLQAISEADAIAEGVRRVDPTPEDHEWHKAWAEEQGYKAEDEPLRPVWMAPGTRQGWGLTKAERDREQWGPTPQFAFRCVWERLHGDGAWEVNPEVVAISFAVEKRNVDDVLKEAA